ncbi:MAG: HNH endonuclease [Chloroflexi bacterium]|nr:MAG: HNH endonuclease [Chloroflexota bacterium]
MYNNRRWRRMRKQWLYIHPRCELCGKPGANVVDHKKPHKGDYDLFWSQDNWQSLHKLCHDSVKACIDNGKTIDIIDEKGSPKGQAWG